MADLEKRIEQELVAAAGKSARLRYARSSLPRPSVLVATMASIAVCLAIVGGALARMDGDRVERPVSTPAPQPRVPDTFAAQLQTLSVLRERAPEDHDPQVRKAARGFGPESRQDYARLLGKAPSGSAFVLVSLRRYEDQVLERGRLRSVSRRNVTCLVRRGSQGGAGSCVTTAELRARGLTGALAGQYYGIVPDGVAAVRLHADGDPVPVRRNFWVADDPGRKVQIRIDWLDEDGRVVKDGSVEQAIDQSRRLTKLPALRLGTRPLNAHETAAVIEEHAASVPLPPGGNFNGIRWPQRSSSGDVAFTLEINAACQWARAYADGRSPEAAAAILPQLASWQALRTTNSAKLWRERASDLLGGGPVPGECVESARREQAYARSRGLTPTR